jgi:CDP-diacylglycerol---glycerol-3-phosphate 3-phosphatidyltransferase
VNLPNSLTVIRIIIVPIFSVILLTPYSEQMLGVSRYVPAIVLFIIAAITDYFDGYLARKRNQVSNFGVLLDPIADKLLVAAALIILVEKNLAPAWAVVIILGREFAVTGLRSIAAADGMVIAAKMVGKIKMWAQCVMIVAFMVAGANSPLPVPNYGSVLPNLQFWEIPEVQTAFSNLFSFATTSNDWRIFGYLVGRAALLVAVGLSIWSMWEYFTLFRRAGIERKRREAEVALSEGLAE